MAQVWATEYMDNSKHFEPGSRSENPDPTTNPSVEVDNSLRSRLQAWWKRNKTRILITCFIVLFLVVYLAPKIFIGVHAGEAGVHWKRFGQGTETNWVYGEGMHIIPPWDIMAIYDVRIQQRDHSFSVISTNGLSIAVDVSIRFRPKTPLLGILHKQVGPDYVLKIVLPEVQALIRDMFGQYTPDEMYTTKRSLIQDSLSRAVGEIGEKFLAVDDLLIKSIRLPPSIQDAIEAKLTQEQRQLEMQFRIGREQLEVERKIIESLGISAYNEIVGRSLNDPLLTFKGIDATLELAKSPNAKIVVIGSKSGLPLILDTRLADAGLSPTNQPAVTPLDQMATNLAGFQQAEKLLPRFKQVTAEFLRGTTNSVNNLLESFRVRKD